MFESFSVGAFSQTHSGGEISAGFGFRNASQYGHDSHIGHSIGGIGWHMSLATDMVRFQMEDAGMLSFRQSDILTEATVNQTEKFNALIQRAAVAFHSDEDDDEEKDKNGDEVARGFKNAVTLEKNSANDS